jgi:hypothetical protein
MLVTDNPTLQMAFQLQKLKLNVDKRDVVSNFEELKINYSNLLDKGLIYHVIIIDSDIKELGGGYNLC